MPSAHRSNSPAPPDAADLSAQVFTPFVPAPTLPKNSPTSSSSLLQPHSEDARLQGRSVAQLLDALDAAGATIASLEQQLATTSSLPRPIPSPSPDQPLVDGMETAHLRGQLRAREEEHVALEMALTAEREHVAALERKIEQMRHLEAGLIDGAHDGGEPHDEAAVEGGGDEAAMDASQLLVRVRALRHRFDRVSRQLQLARQHIRELEVDRERHSSGSVEEQEERAKREAALVALQREHDNALRERDGLRGERDHLLHQLQQAIAAAANAASSVQPSSDTALVRRPPNAGDDSAQEVQRLRAMVGELQRHADERPAAAAHPAPAASADGSLLTASVGVNRFFLVSFLLLLVAVLVMQLAKPEWLAGLDLMGPGASGGSGGAAGGGGAAAWDASREL